MKSEEEIKADFWTQKIALLRNMLRYGAPAFDIDQLYQALLQAGWTSRHIVRTSTRSFFGTECPTLQLSLGEQNDITIVRNPGIQTLDMTIQSGREPVSLTGASIESVIGTLRTYTEYYPRYREALDKRLQTFRNSAKEEAKRQKIKKLALSNIQLVLPGLFAGSDYRPYLIAGETEALLCIRLKAGKTMEIKLPYTEFQKILPSLHPAIIHMEKAVSECPLRANISDTDYWNGEDFTVEASPNK